MKRILSIIATGVIALLSLSSCQWDLETGKCEAYLTCYYAGGLPSATSYQTYQLNDMYMSDMEIEDIFLELSEVVKPGFTNATLEIDLYDWAGDYERTEVYEFWWEVTDPISGNGYYAWDEVHIDR